MNFGAGQLILTNQFGEESFNQVQGLLLVGATAPVNGTTGDNVSPKGGLYVALDTGALYQNTGTITAPVWAEVAPNADLLATALSGFTAGAGTVADTDTVLEAIEKLAGNLQNRAVTANLLTGLAAGADEAIADTDTVLEALAKLQAQIDALA